MLTNSVVRPSARAKSSAISTSKPTRRSGRDGSASTNGAPPSGSPAQRRTLGCAAAKTTEDTKAAKNAKDRANTGVDFMRRRCDGDCRLSRYGAARERDGGADAAERRRGHGVESYGGQGARARAARREGGRVAGRGRRRRRARAHDAARRRRRRSNRRRRSSPPRPRRHPADALAVFSKFQPGGVIKARGEKMARGDFSATFELTMARKDMRLMLEAADGQPMVVLPSIAERMDRAIASGHGKADLGAIAAEGVR